jgi:hypothetical protein
MRPPPSMVVLAALTSSVCVILMLTGFAPQLNVTLPPPVSADASAARVQLPGVPSPTTPAA